LKTSRVLKVVLLSLLLQPVAINFSWANELKPQEITFNTPDSLMLTDSPSDLNAISSSGLQVKVLSSSSTVCDVVDSRLILKSQGNCVLVASQPGDAKYAAAPEIKKQIKVHSKEFAERLLLPKIVGGAQIPISDAPWQVGLIYSNATSNYLGQFCGGSIISNSWILTAAHCLVEDNSVLSVNSFRVLVGSANLSTTSLTNLKSVNQVVIHPSYNSNSNDYDIALIRLTQPLTFVPNSIQAISLNQSEIAPGKDALITGWGATNSKAPWESPSGYSNQLQGGFVDIDSNTKCSNFEFGFNAQTMLCASTPSFSVDTCQGDSGGPLAIFESGQWKLAGVTSFGDGCAWLSPGYYTKVSNFYVWTNSTIQTTQSPLSISNTARSVAINTPITLTTSGGSGSGAVSFNVTGANCISSGIGNSQLSASTSTSCSVTATKAADATFASATSAVVTFTFLSAQATLSISNTTTTNSAGTRITLTTTGGSGSGAVTFTVAGSGCSISRSTLTARNATTCTVVATKAAQGMFAPATSEGKLFTFTAPRMTQSTLSISNTTRSVGINTPITLTTSGGSGSGAVSFNVTGANCILAGVGNSQLSASTSTSCSVTATKAADATFDSATSAAVTFTFLDAQATLTISNTTRSVAINTPITLTTSGGSGSGAVSFNVTGANCILAGVGNSQLSASTSTSCSVTATKAAQGRFASATSAAVTFTFLSAQATLSISNATTTNIVRTRITLTTTGGSGTGVTTYSLSPSNFVCTLSNQNGATTLTARNATTCTVIATKAAQGMFAPTTSAPVSFIFTARL